jgi:hypothetical protein
MVDSRGAYRVLVGNIMERHHLGDPGTDERIIPKLIIKKWDWGGGMHWIDLAQDRHRWRAVINSVMNLRVAQNFSTT